jgi:GTP diphosphokinase / guanosine-3',5'-bis(diphosphate) 3'-diphosphatase
MERAKTHQRAHLAAATQKLFAPGAVSERDFAREFYDKVKPGKGFDKKLVYEAFGYAKTAHQGQLRRSGEPYIHHPFCVAKILLELGMSSQMVATAFLHDVVEDTSVPILEIEQKFGKEVAGLVQGVTNLGQVDFSTYSKEELQAALASYKNENLRKLFLSMAEDVRVVIIKLADRLHNMKTIKALAKKDQERIARETLNIFAPLALRLGMGEIKGELEDLAFPIAFPEEYRMLKKEANRRYKAADRYTLQVKRLIADKLSEEKIPNLVEGRAKHIYSLYRKIIRPEINWDFSKIYDLVALRIITDNVPDCYRIMGIIHAMYRPMPNYIRDYIAAPKPNGYRSIHTSVFGPAGKVIEIQIRTQEMHEEAEFGVASHLHYAETKTKGVSDEKLQGGTFAKKHQTDFLKQIKEWQSSVLSAADFVEGLKFEFLDERIYVFSPMGDIYDLPVGATPVDFAYEVHSRVGDTAVGAKVNGKIVTLDKKLKTRDVVEIITQKKSAPKRNWLDFVKTSKAKQHIRGHFRKFDFDKYRDEGEREVTSQLSLLGMSLSDFSEADLRSAISETSFKALDDILASVGSGITTPRQAIKMITGRTFLPEKPVSSATLALPKKRVKTDFKGLKINIAPCCEPEKKDDIVSFVTRGKGITLHKKSCPNVANLEKERTFDYNPWLHHGIEIPIEVIARNRLGLIRDVTAVISSENVNIEKFKNNRVKDGYSKFNIVVSVDDLSLAAKLITRLSQVRDVREVKRGG